MATAFQKVMDDRKKIVETLLEKIKAGYVYTPEEWNSFFVRPQNPVSNVYYKGVNRLRLGFAAALYNYKDPRWLTYNQAQKQGWQVKRGAKGVLCEKWIFSQEKKEIDPVTKEEKKVEVPLEKPMVNYFVVFNAEQVENIPELVLPELTKTEVTKITDDLIRSSECKIKEVASEGAYYSPSKDEITLPLRNVFKDENAFCSVAAHEMIHSTGHMDRLNRDISGTFGTIKYAREEVTAELGAVFVLSNLGVKIDNEHLSRHSNYLKNWLDVLTKDYNELFKIAKAAELGADRVYSRYLENQRVEEKEYFKGLEVKYHYGEGNFNIPDNTVLKGAVAYEFLKELIKKDKDINRRNKINNTHYYDKVYIDFRYKDFSRKDMRIDLGDLEFKRALKVSTAMDNRLLIYTEELKNIELKRSIMKRENWTFEEYDTNVKQAEKDVKIMTKEFKEAEKEYTQEVEKTKSSWGKKREKENGQDLEY